MPPKANAKKKKKGALARRRDDHQQRKEKRTIKTQLTEETCKTFHQTATDMLLAFMEVWPDDELITMACEEWDKHITQTSGKTRIFRCSYVLSTLDERLTPDIVELLNKRDMNLFDVLEERAETELKTPSRTQRIALMLASMAGREGCLDLITALGVKDKLLEGALDEESTENVWKHLDKLCQTVIMFRVSENLSPSIVDVVQKVKEKFSGSETPANPAALFQNVFQQVQSIPQEEVKKLSSAISPESMGVLLRGVDGHVPDNLRPLFDVAAKATEAGPDGKRNMDPKALQQALSTVLQSSGAGGGAGSGAPPNPMAMMQQMMQMQQAASAGASSASASAGAGGAPPNPMAMMQQMMQAMGPPGAGGQAAAPMAMIQQMMQLQAAGAGAAASEKKTTKTKKGK